MRSPTVRRPGLRVAGTITLLFSAISALSGQTSERALILDSIAREHRELGSVGAGVAALQLTIARQEYRIGNDVAGRRAYLAAATDTTPDGSAIFWNDLLLGKPGLVYVKARWDSMSASARSTNVRSAWDEDDVERGRSDGVSLAVYYRRLLDARARFGFRSGLNAGALDDRGTVWIKQGAPAASVRIRDHARYEIWRYARPFGPMILYFRSDDSAEHATPMHLVASIEDAPNRVRVRACQVDRASCTGPAHRTPTPGMFSGPAARDTSRPTLFDRAQPGPPRTVRGAEGDEYATTAYYDHPARGRTLHPSIQAIWDRTGASESPRLIFAFAFPDSELAATRPGGSRFRVRFKVLTDDFSGRLPDHDTTLILTRRQSDPIGSIEGVLSLTQPIGTEVVIKAWQPGRGSVLLSDGSYPFGVDGDVFVAGRRSGGLSWVRDTEQVWLNPSHQYLSSDSIHLFVETMPLVNQTYFEAELILGSGHAPARAKRLVTRLVPLPDNANAAYYRFDVPLDTLPPGAYYLSFSLRWHSTTNTSVAGAQPTELFTIVKPDVRRPLCTRLERHRLRGKFCGPSSAPR